MYVMQADRMCWKEELSGVGDIQFSVGCPLEAFLRWFYSRENLKKGRNRPSGYAAESWKNYPGK